MLAQAQNGTIEYAVNNNPWRVNQGKQFIDHFRIEAGNVAKFHFWIEGRPDLKAPWTVTRLFFGIEPLIQSENANPDFYGNSLSIDEIAEVRKCDSEEVKMELEVISAAWKAFQRTMPADTPDPEVPIELETYTAPSDQPPQMAISNAPLLPVQEQMLRYRGFSPSEFKSDDKSRGEDQENMELQALYQRLMELKKVFDEPMAKEIARQALINECHLRRIDQKLWRMDVSSPKYAILRETKKEIESSLLKQWEQIEKICPFVKGAINKMTAIGAFSDLARGYMEWKRDKTKMVVDGMFTNYEIQVEMRESQQLPPHYRPGWVAAMLEARAGLFDPNFRRTMPNSKCKILDMAFQAAAKSFNERWAIKLPDLLKEGPDGEYPDIVLADAAGEEDEPLELRERENIDDQLAAEALPPIELDKSPDLPATNGAASLTNNGR